MRKHLLIVAMVIFIQATFSHADRRSYVWTYQYMTLPEGFTELEFYQTTKISDIEKWEYRIEVEHGITLK